MADVGIRESIYETFYKEGYSLIDLLNNSSCDEIVEIDTINNTFFQPYHVEGKYFVVPAAAVSYKDLFEFAVEHVVHPEDREIYLSLMNQDGFFERLKNSRIPNFDFVHFRYKLQDGTYRYVEQCVIAGEENGLRKGIFRIYVFDIHNLMVRKLGGIAHNEKNVISNGRDAITGLLDQKSFEAAATKRVSTKKANDWCLIAMDIEHFKFFDEWYGRDKGDYLLGRIGVTLRESEKSLSGIAGYFGQDDFVFLCKYNEKKIEELYDKIRDLIISFGFSVGFMPAFGISLIEKDMLVLDAFDRATIAASEAKKDIRHRICVYNTEMQFQSEREYRIISEYMQAFKNDEITFYLQPQCRISTGKIVGAESLARWIKPDGTIVPPDVYIPILEKYGFIADLDQRLWEKVCICLRNWLDGGHKAVPVSLNVSRADIFTIDVHQHFVDLTEKYNIPHKLIKIEITESAYTETTGMIGDLVKKLRKDGFLVLMDDFGSGYSSLNMLSNLKVDAIKLDAKFLHIEDSEREKGIHILESVVNMAKQIAVPIIVEGVENQKQSDFLEGLGCRYVQGFHFYRPMPVDKFEKIIINEKNIDDKGFVAKLNEQFRIREFLDKNIYSDSMLNNILGAVALYSVREGKHVDIIRYNQQFYETVNVPDFAEKLENIEKTMPREDAYKLLATFKKARDDKLLGAAEFLRFYTSDGTLLTYRMKFYYLGKKEGTERYYGSSLNVTELADLRDEKAIVTEFSSDNIILIRKRNGQLNYSVISHGLSADLGLKPKELEKEMNEGQFAKRVVNRAELTELMQDSLKIMSEQKNFERIFYIKDIHNKPRKVLCSFTCLTGRFNNVEYLLRTKIVD